ncbi:hypothetical protein [Burkholderia gladioli]|nr:hypothetical protein [Burkholderia gladioli]
MKTIPRIAMATVLAILPAPLFQLLDANGIETEEGVLMGVLSRC